MNNDITDLLKRHDKWREQRTEYFQREESDPVSSSNWEASDDEGVSLGEEAIELLRQPIKVWTCRVLDRENDEDTVTVHLTEEAIWESLRENFDPEGLSDDEPPVAIVEYLETQQGMRIDIDVHEVSR